MTIKILIVDDHSIVREGLRAVLSHESDFEVIGEAINGEIAVSMAAQFCPDIVLMDIIMPKMNGNLATEKILANNPKIKVIALTSLTDIENIQDAIKAGVDGYMVKNSDPKELIRAIKDVNNGSLYIQNELAGYLLRVLQSDAKASTDYAELKLLSERELEILRLITEGLSNESIGYRLSINLKTVGAHISHILDKLNVSNRTQAAIYAFRSGLVKLFPDQ